MKTKPIQPAQIEDVEDEDINIQRRRIAVYSITALKQAAKVDGIWVMHHGFSDALKALDRIFQIVPEFNMPQGMLIEGPAGVGKTSIYRYFRETLPTSHLFANDYGIVGIRATAKSGVGYYIRSLLQAYKYPFVGGPDQQLYARRGVLIDLIKSKGTRIIFVDEATSIFTKSASTPNKYESAVTDFFRELVDECQVGLVMSTYSSAFELETIDKALASRLTVKHLLKPFDCDSAWRGLLNTITKQDSGYDLSLISDSGVAKRLHDATQGNIRNLKRLLTEAVLIGVDSNQVLLDPKILTKAFNTIGGRHELPNPFE